MACDKDGLAVKFYKMIHLMGRGMYQYYRKREHPVIHPSQGRLLGIIGKKGTVSQKELVELLDVRPSSLSELLKKLEVKNLIERKPDEQDKRNVNVTLTAEGEKVAEQVSGGRNQIASQMFDALTEQEQEELGALLDKLIANWQDTETYDMEDDRSFFPGGMGAAFFHRGMHPGHGSHGPEGPDRRNPRFRGDADLDGGCYYHRF